MQVFEQWKKPEVVLLDVGMATELSGDDRNNMLALFQAFSNMDGAAMAQATLNFAGEAQRCLNPEGFKAAISEYVVLIHKIFPTLHVCLVPRQGHFCIAHSSYRSSTVLIQDACVNCFCCCAVVSSCDEVSPAFLLVSGTVAKYVVFAGAWRL